MHEEVFQTTFSVNSKTTFQTEFTENESYSFYKGNYTVVPNRTEQILATTAKVMMQDVFVAEIPYSETSNTAGGKTFYIAKEIEE